MSVYSDSAFATSITVSGLHVHVNSGTISAAGTVVSTPAALVDLVDNTLNYLFLDLVAIDVAVNQTGFPAYCFPVAKVTTKNGFVTNIEDSRVDFLTVVVIPSGSPGNASVVTSGSGEPNNVVAGKVGDLYINLASSGVGHTFWVKESGTPGSNTGWVGK